MSDKQSGETEPKTKARMGVFHVTPAARQRAANAAKRKHLMGRLLDVWEGKRTTHAPKGNHA